MCRLLTYEALRKKMEDIVKRSNNNMNMRVCQVCPLYLTVPRYNVASAQIKNHAVRILAARCDLGRI
jgi:hypothetical protein